MTADGRALGVALLAEGVDRNTLRRMVDWEKPDVALLAEGVDRNTAALKDKLDGIGRPPRGGRG